MCDLSLPTGINQLAQLSHSVVGRHLSADEYFEKVVREVIRRALLTCEQERARAVLRIRAGLRQPPGAGDECDQAHGYAGYS